jgi:hypothetical protein
MAPKYTLNPYLISTTTTKDPIQLQNASNVKSLKKIVFSVIANLENASQRSQNCVKNNFIAPTKNTNK